MDINTNLPKNFFEELDWSLLMQSISDYLSTRPQLSTDSSKLNLRPSVDNCKLLTEDEISKILQSTEDLINASYRDWYLKRLFAVGPAKYTQIAAHARKYGKDPSKLFSSLLKRA